LQALVAAGANSDTPMANAWISKVALEIGLKGEEFHSALVYAGGQDWLDNDQKEGWTSLTRVVRRLQELGPLVALTTNYRADPATPTAN
jgi:hypothetical protein